METRIYVVEVDHGEDPKETRLIEASTPAQALRHVVRNMATCEVASAKRVAELVGKGVQVETA